MMVHLSPIRQVVVAAALAFGAAHSAFAADPLVEGARQCTQQFPVQEQRKGIPTHLLAAISSTESGRWHDRLGLALPWPWTINVEGKGYYFDSKAEAIAQTAKYLRQGKQSIDVGCMQVNLKHHAGAFKTLDEAFDPATNVAYGAQFLRNNYDDLGNWIKATAAYHSRTNKLGNEYLARIEKSWNRIVAKVQQARERQGIAGAAPANPNFNVASAEEPAKATPASRMKPLASTRNVRVVKVSERAARPDVLIVRTSSNNSTPVNMADASPLPEMMVQQTTPGDSIRRVTIDSSGGSANTGSSATKFVFAN